MKRLLLTVAILFTALAHAVGAAAATTFQLQQPRNAVVGRPYQVTFVLSTDEQRVINTVSDLTPERPSIDGMRLYSGPGTSTGFESGYDSRRGSYSLYTCAITFVYIPEREGKVTIPSVSIRAGGQVYKSREAEITVLPDGNLSAVGGSSQQGQNGNGQSGSSGAYRQAARERVMGSSVGQTDPKDLMVIITFSRSSVYEMEPVVADIKLCLKLDRRFDIGDQFSSVTLPEFDGFLSEDLPVPRSSQVENIGGVNYETIVIRRYLLYPQKAGRLRVSSGRYEIDVLEYEIVTRGFMQTRREVPRKMSTATNTVTLDVKALPEPRPAGFSGAVGNFQVSAAVSPQIVRSNESATYTLTVKGSGNIKYLNAPAVTFPSTFETYTPKTDIEANFNGSNYAGTFTADYPFVPQEVGKFTIGSFPFIYFNPSTAKYVTVEAPAFELNVLRGNGPAVVTAQKEVSTELTDILHINPLGSSISVPAAPVFGRWWYWMIYCGVALTLIVVVIVYRAHVKRSADVAGRRLARANRIASKRFSVARKYLKAHKPDLFYDELARALKGFIGDKLSIAPSGLISDTIAEKLLERGVPQETVTEVIDVLNDCEMARFTPSGSDDAMSDVLGRAEHAVKALQDTLK